MMTSPSPLQFHAFPVCSPYDGSVVGEILPSRPDEVVGAVVRAQRAAAAFRHSTPFERRSLLGRLADLLARDGEVLARTITQEMGKTLTEARNEVRRAGNTLRLSGDAATFLDGEVIHCAVVAGGVDRQAVVTLRPVGVVAAITPFNYPVSRPSSK